MHRILISALLLISTVVAQELPADHAERMKVGTELFRKTVRSALTTHCLKCHGDEKVRADFDLSSRESLLESGFIDTEAPGDSYLLMVIRHEEEPTMPPAKEKLPEKLIASIERWIALGAPYDKPLIEKSAYDSTEMKITESDRNFWSFRPLADVEPPKTDSDWPNSDIDRFVLRKLREKNLQPNKPADDRSRIRRTYLDLIGLPPTIDQLNAALKMSQEALVNELLASPHYGERWARHWLDAARFAESHGFEQDYDRKFAYHYRDFVIKALNADMPWDQFVRWQIAGDEIAPEEPLALMATGFLGAGVFPTQLTEKEFESARYDELDDMAATTGTAMLGLTIGCARCHDHKFDPLPVKDYYRFVSTFTTTIRSEIDVELDSADYQKDLAKWEAQHSHHVDAVEAFTSKPETTAAFEKWLKTDAKSAAQDGDWTVLNITEAKSDKAATTLTPQVDGAVRASGKAPKAETYTVKAVTQSHPIRFIRLEALTDNSMPRNGPGRAGNGNFGLGNFTVSVRGVAANQPQGASPGSQPKQGSQSDQKTGASALRLIGARATHQQNTDGLSIAASINDNNTNTGWAVDFGGIGKDQAAVFQLEEPLEFDGEVELEFKLAFAVNTAHSLGRFRISVSNAADPPVEVGKGRSESLDAALAALKKNDLKPEHRDTLFAIYTRTDAEWNKLNDAVQASLAKKPTPNKTKVQVSSEGFPPTKHHADGRGFPHFYPQTHFLNRGDPNQKDGVAESGYLQVLMRNGKTTSDWQQEPPADWTRTSYRRTGMANWLTDVENGAGHLLARVIVNRLWHHHFGRGIVATPNDFGLQGELPTHPELLDYLAQKLIDGGWNLKPLHREILLSSTWLQSSAVSSEKTKIDPDNQYLWRFTPRRLEAEIVRDAMLSASGQLDETMYGPGTLNAAHQRRSIYFMIKRSRLVPMMQIFDQPEPLSSQGSRPSTTIAPQALMFMNNQQVVKWASAFAKEVASLPDEESVTAIYLRTLGREPTDAELNDNVAFLTEQTTTYERNGRQMAFADLCQVVFGLNEFIYLP